MTGKGFPQIKFGPCPVCGGSGGDDPDAGGADAPARDTTGNGYRLEYYQGELMCNICKQTKIGDAESVVAASKHADSERFRAQAGFKRRIS